jgi:hypothetical protein
MSERGGLPTTMPMDDLELVTRYLNQQLDPERAEQVRVRLESDPEFYNLAEPLLFAWSVPRHVERHPRPPGELEEMWDRFAKRAGYAHPRRKARQRRLWLLLILAFAIGIPAFVMRGQVARAYRDFRDFETVRADTGWITMRDSNQVRLAPGARLRSSKRIEKGVHRVRLEGSARFRVYPADTAGPVPMMQPLAVETRGGLAFTGMGEFTVTTRGDTTDVEVHRPSRRRFIGFMAMPTTVLVETEAHANPISLGETQAARLIRGGRAERTKR